MRRSLPWIVAGLLLATLAAGARLRLEATGVQRTPASLLYLPKGPYLRALALGHEEVLADLLYVWAIQYYSNYEDRARYQYLDAVFRGAITELDPMYTEVYLIGALIMSLEARRPDLALALLDKGLEQMPDNWELAFWAGWEGYSGRDYLLARRYWARAAAMPGAPPHLARLAARMIERAGDREAAVAEYERLAAGAPDEKTRTIARSWLDRLRTEQALEDARRALAAFRQRHGRCPSRLDALVREGLLAATPRGPDGAELHYESDRCAVLPPPGWSFGGRR